MNWALGVRGARNFRLGVTGGALMLGACMAPIEHTPLRDPKIQLSASTRFDPVRFQGDWHVLAIAGTGTFSEKMSFTYDVMTKVMTRPGSPQVMYDVHRNGVLKRSGSKPQTLVVMWVDEGFRTAAIGTRDGAFAAILGRSLQGRPDQYTAALRVLKFNGWDTSRLTKVRK